MNPAKTRRGLDVGHGRNGGHSAMIGAPTASFGLPGYARFFLRGLASAGLGLVVASALGCASQQLRQVARYEEAGDDTALRQALLGSNAEVRAAAAQALVRYGAYDTGRPAVLGTLSRSQSPEAKAAARQLFGVPPLHTPDPFPTAQAPADTTSQVVLYVYRPPGDGGAAQWARIDTERSVRLQPGRYLRLVTSPGNHRMTVQLPDEAAPLTDDPSDNGERMRKVAPLLTTVSTPAAGVYFVRYTTLQGTKRPEFKVMPVPPALQLVKTLRAADAADCDQMPTGGDQR